MGSSTWTRASTHDGQDTRCYEQPSSPPRVWAATPSSPTCGPPSTSSLERYRWICRSRTISPRTRCGILARLHRRRPLQTWIQRPTQWVDTDCFRNTKPPVGIHFISQRTSTTWKDWTRMHLPRCSIGYSRMRPSHGLCFAWDGNKPETWFYGTIRA